MRRRIARQSARGRRFVHRIPLFLSTHPTPGRSAPRYLWRPFRGHTRRRFWSRSRFDRILDAATGRSHRCSTAHSTS